MPASADRRPSRAARDSGALQFAGQRLLETYAGLAECGEHLLHGVLGGESPRQWEHYPHDDAIDGHSGYQWFYHSHSPEDRPDAAEHGHIHLFARRKLWSRRMQANTEREFARLTGNPDKQVNTRHLIGIGLDEKGIPTSLFTVNSWVTGDLMLSAEMTHRLLRQIRLETEYSAIDAVIESVLTLCAEEIRELLSRRDEALATHGSPSSVLDDHSLEVLSETRIDLDQKLGSLFTD